jgi:SPP1 family predicted phage head-tail adaptor
MQAGELRHRLRFEARVTQDTDQYGGAVTDWAEQFTVAAAVKAKFGGEAVTAARLDGRQPLIVTVRQSSDTRQITTDWRATDIYSGDVLNIRSIADPDDRGQWLEMLTEKGVAT